MALTKATNSMIQGASVNVLDYGAVGDGVADDSAAIQAAIVASYTGNLDGVGRKEAGTVHFPVGTYKITSALEIGGTSGCFGLIMKGAGTSSVILNFTGTVGFEDLASRAVTFEDMTFQATTGVDGNTIAFNLSAPTSLLRSWKFNRCDFYAWWKCFNVTGTVMCSEFFFTEIQFANCYYLMFNTNDQAVNWTFTNCNWENNELSTTKPLDASAMFYLTKGSFITWNGGSIILYGLMVFFNLLTSASFQRTVHKVAFTGIRLELVDNAGGHFPLVDKTQVGYVVGSNTPSVSFSDFTILNRGTIPPTVNYMNLWENCSLVLTDGDVEGGTITGIVTANTASLMGNLWIENVAGLTYIEDTAARVSDHDSHIVHFSANNRTGGTQPITDLRPASLAIPVTAEMKKMYVRGPTGSLPEAATTVNLPTLLDRFTITKMFVYRFATAAQALTVELKDQGDTTLYGTLTAGAGVAAETEVYIGKEMGFQIPSGTALMLKFTGTPEVVKGVVGIEYL
jgi:hypothetical protein